MDKLLLLAAIGIYAAGVVWPLWVEWRNARPVRTDGPLRDSGTHEAVVGQRIEEG